METKLKKIFLYVLPILLLTIIAIIFIPPFILFLLLPILFWRLCVSISAKLCKIKLGKIVNARSSFMAAEGNESPYWNVSCLSTFKGHITVEHFAETTFKNVLNKKHPKTHKLLYPEMSQFIYQWMGFMFWKWEDGINYKRHFSVYSGKLANLGHYNEESLFRVHQDISTTPFYSEMSPWEVIFLHNYKPINALEGEVYTVIFLKISHAMADGSGIAKLIYENFFTLSEQDNMALVKPQFPSRTIGEKLLWVAKFPFVAPYELIEQMYRSSFMAPLYNHIDDLRANKEGETIAFPCQIIKDVKEIHAVGFTTVLFAAVAGALRRFFIYELEMNEIPDFIDVAIPLPMPGHPNSKLRNHFSFAKLKFPIGEKNPVKRLRLMGESFEATKNSTTPLFVFALTSLFGSLFPSLIRKLVGMPKTDVILSYMPLSQSVLAFEGNPCVEVSYLGGLGLANTGILLTLSSYLNVMRVTASFDPRIKPNKKANIQSLADFVLDELKILKVSTEDSAIV